MPVFMLGPRSYTDFGLGSLRVSLGHGIEREQGPPQSVLGLRVRFKRARGPGHRCQSKFGKLRKANKGCPR